MNDKFFSLPEEKQEAILNASLEIFSKYEYKHASTDDIAAKAGISKGLLFYYFHNKKSLFMYLYDYTSKLVTSQIQDDHFETITDFFELLKYSSFKKMSILTKHPYITDFTFKAFFLENDLVTPELQKKIQTTLNGTYHHYFKNIDFSKFKDSFPPDQLLKMLLWMSEGYMHELKRNNLPYDLTQIMKDFDDWCTMFKKLSYKEEYLNECN